VIHVGSKKRKGYPLYLYITYNRKNMQFKSSHSMWYADMEDVERQSPGLMDREIKLINQIIRYEETLLKVDAEYVMKGFKERYDDYSVSIRDVLEKYLKVKLQFEIKRTDSPLLHVLDFRPDKGLADFEALYEAAQKLYGNLFETMDNNIRKQLDWYCAHVATFKSKGKHDFPSLIDWHDGSFRSEIVQAGRMTKNELSIMDTTIDNAIDHYLKQK